MAKRRKKRGPRSPAQIAASRANLVKARAARSKAAGTATGAASPFSSTTGRRIKAGAKTADVVAFSKLSAYGQKKVAKGIGIKHSDIPKSIKATSTKVKKRKSPVKTGAKTPTRTTTLMHTTKEKLSYSVGSSEGRGPIRMHTR